jgi:hypothetical protein
MKKLLFILLFILSFTLIQGQNYYDTDPTKYEAPGDSTQYYVLGIFRIGSDPGGWENRNTFWIDSLFNSLVVYTDTSQLFIRNDTLFISESFLTSAIDSVNFDTINATYINATHMLAQAIQTDTLKVDWIDSITTEIIKTYVIRLDSVNVATTHQQGKMEYDSTSHSVVYYTEEPDITMKMEAMYIRQVRLEK